MQLLNKTPKLRGDRALWTLILIISFFSIFPVYSASSNLDLMGNGSSLNTLARHLGYIIAGIFIMIGLTYIPYYRLRFHSSIIFLVSLLLLSFTTIFVRKEISGATAARWINIPMIGISIQPSSFAYLALIFFLCTLLSSSEIKKLAPWKYLGIIFAPVLITSSIVLVENGSSGLLILASSLAIMLIAGMNWKIVARFLFFCILAITLYVSAAKAGLTGANRVDTWTSRIDNFFNKDDQDIFDEKNKTKHYQSNLSKAAIIHGGLYGVGPGKGALKQVLPQSVSDFIFAIIIEEWGSLIGGGMLMVIYMGIIIRTYNIAKQSTTFFGTLLALSMGVMLILQIVVNISVAIDFFPVTGQPLPFMSFGGSAMIVSYMQIGLILNVSAHRSLLGPIEPRTQTNIHPDEEILDIA